MTARDPTAQSAQTRRRVLVVEDEFYIAEDLANALSAAGLEVVGPACSVSDALRYAESADIHGAIVDINLKDELALPVTDALLSREVPFVITTGYDRRHLDAKHRELDCFEKPFNPAKVIAKLQEKMALKTGR